MTRDDRLTDARDLGLDPDDTVALVDGTASWQSAAGIFARRLAAAAEGTYRPSPGTDQLIRRHLMDAQTALGRVYRAYLDAADLNGNQRVPWREVLVSTVEQARGFRAAGCGGQPAAVLAGNTGRAGPKADTQV